MRKVLLTVLTLVFVSSFGFAEMNLKLNKNLLSETNSSIISNNLESNLKLEVPAEVVTPPADMKDFVKGMMLLGVLADVSFPMGGDEGFGHIAGTGFSGHIMFGYMVAKAWMIAIRGGYIAFGTQTTSGSEDIGFGQELQYNYEDCYSQIPILFGAYYIFATKGAFKPYLGLALGLFIQNYKFTWTDSYTYLGQTYSDKIEGDASSTGFGIVPAAGFHFLVGSIILTAAVEYAYLFSNLPTPDSVEYTPSELSKVARIAQDEGEDEFDEKASYISVNVGVSFPLGQ